MLETWSGRCYVTCLRLLALLVLPGVYGFKLTVLHTNDVHARFDESTDHGSICRTEENNTCYAGIARRTTAIRELRAKYENVLLLDAGDQFQGTLWFSVHKGNAAVYFMNKLRYDAMALGNHEFDNSIRGLIPFLYNSSFPVVCSNIDATDEPTMNGLFNKSVVLNVGGRRVGIVGYITAETPILSKEVGRVRFLDEVSSIQAEVDRLTNQNVDIIIALGHAGIKKDREIASKVRNIDLIVGGHTNTFLYTGKAPAREKPEGEYPIVVTQPNKDRVLVVQAYAFGKYLGFLQMTFDDRGKVANWSGNPILMDNKIEKDPEVAKELKKWRVPLQLLYTTAIGTTVSELDGDFVSCRMRECTVGNLMTDAMVYHYRRKSGRINNLNIALLNGGSIRSSIDEGNITMAEIMETLPFGQTVDVVEFLGTDLLEVLEHSVKDYDPCNRHGKFLQISGLRVVYDVSKPNGQRVQQVTVLDNSGQYVPLNNASAYNVSMISYAIQGGDGYSMIAQRMRHHYNFGSADIDVMSAYVSQKSPINVTVEERIRFIPVVPDECVRSGSSHDLVAASASLLSSALIVSMVALAYSTDLQLFA